MAPPGKYLQYDLGVLTRLYAHEPGVSIGMPYVHLKRWSVNDEHTPETAMTVTTATGKFELRDKGSASWHTVSSAAFRELGEDGHDLARSELLVRVSDFDPHSSVLSVQQAEYNDQRRSNLVLDFRVPGEPTLREMLSAEYGPCLPRLSDERLANTLGIAVMVIVRQRGRLCAYCVRRASKGVAVFQDTWSCTAAGAAKWARADAMDTFPHPLTDMLAELEEEAGLKLSDLTFIKQVSLSREIVRAGKPEFMFLAGCLLSAAELSEKRRRARRLAARLKQPMEVEPDTLLRSAAWYVDLRADPATFFSEDIAHQASGLLLEAVDQLGDLEALL